MGCWRVVVFVATFVAGCDRKPIFKDPVPANEKGGFVVQCYNFTDLQHRIQPCSTARPYHNDDGGCACAQPGVALGLPPLADRNLALGAMAFQDTSCTGSYIAACMPRVIPTRGDWSEDGLPAGQLRLYRFLQNLPDNALRVVPLPQNIGNDPFGSLSGFEEAYKAEITRLDDPFPGEKREQVLNDVRNVMRSGCLLAHWAALQYYVTGFAAGSVDWPAAVNAIGAQQLRWTTTLDGFDLRTAAGNSTAWGDVTIIVPPGAEPVEPRVFVTHALEPNIICGPDLTYPALGEGFPTLLALGAGNREPYVSNAPPKSSGNIAPRQQAVLSPGSSALLTVGDLEPVTLNLTGGLELVLTACTSPASCTARLNSLVLRTSSFRMEGHDVAMLRIISGDVGTGTLVGSTLALTSLSAELEVKLTDGRYDIIPLTGGVALANWNVEQNRFVFAFSFSGVAQDVNFSVNGTAFGSFPNTSPSAHVTIVDPQPISQIDDRITVQCQAPNGTTVTLSGATSVDREDNVLKFAWYDADRNRLSSSANLTVSNLALGVTSLQLMAYDTIGLTANDRVDVEVVDTLPPRIEASDVCIAPPNHGVVELRLGSELLARAVDQCDGEIATLAIKNVTSSADAGLISWDPQSLCVKAERAGRETTDRTYSVTLSATDATGNEATSQVKIVVPHNGPITNCLRTQSLPSCN